MAASSTNNLKLAEKGVWVSIIAYIVLSIGQIAFAAIVHSSALQANGFNNVTDIMGNIAILIGLRLARIPADSDHVYGHWKIESIASLISSFIMFFVGFEVLRETVMTLLSGKEESIDPLGALVGLFSAFVMLGVYLYNRALAKKTNSQALSAASKDNLSDAVTSIGTVVAILASSVGWEWLDTAMAVVICGFILKTAYDIFHESVFSLSDGFDENLVEEYREAICLVPKVKGVKLVRGRSYGSNIFLDVVVEMSPDLSVFESHEATEFIEKMLIDNYGVYDVDVHVEPAALPEEEHYASRSLELLAKEEQFLNLENLDKLTDSTFQEILADGKIINASDKLKDFAKITDENSVSKNNDSKNSLTSLSVIPLAINHYSSSQVSKKTFILTYDYWKNEQNFVVTSIWRRNDYWRCIYRQTTLKREEK
ncbi:cation diffusion facilitator family transporter [Lactococcus lactis]|uniref:cation diffusion facilitator family transporter n=1 Tax=Lactococcus lactis TaxID=1358 RepID=UPI001911D534|nr:cation diffusion facilitator family transporter [Lactococcus lactis]MCT0447782.1 cation transporter [Lactococcus lactis subsp. lactis]WDA68518.1 cation diffusion facilitator family transporter [Lactococcus lactis]